MLLNPHRTLFSQTSTGVSSHAAATHHRKTSNLNPLSATSTHSHHRRRLLHLRSLPSEPRFRPQRSRSESNLEGLNQDFMSMLQTEPSFCVYADEDGVLENRDLGIERVSSGDFSFAERGMGLIVEGDEDDRLSGFKGLGIGEKGRKEGSQIEPLSPKMYLATGFGIDGIDGQAKAMGINNGGFESRRLTLDENGDAEEYYERMVAEDPCNPLFLRNYAHLLQSKGDLTGAEDYYFRATLEDPKDGEILMQYAKLSWELHRDQDRALSFFERAALAAPEGCNVLGAYASFLWDIDEAENNGQCTELVQRTVAVNGAGHGGNVDFASEGSAMDGGNLEEYHKRMVDENPCNPLVLRNYAQFLQQCKRDVGGAEEYYSRAMLADPGDGDVISRYAQLVWEARRDQDAASRYFERAVGAAPADSGVLAAYAKFLWEADDEEDGGRSKDDVRVPVAEGAVAVAPA